MMLFASRLRVVEGIEIRCSDPRVPLDQTNTCWKIAERVLMAVQQGNIASGAAEPQIPRLASLPRDDNSTSGDLYGTAQAARVQHEIHTAVRRKIVVQIEKRLPVQGGMGAASSNAVATMLAMERALGITLSPQDKLRIAAEVGSDLPLFLIGGTVLGVGRGEEVFPLAGSAAVACGRGHAAGGRFDAASLRALGRAEHAGGWIDRYFGGRYNKRVQSKCVCLAERRLSAGGPL